MPKKQRRAAPRQKSRHTSVFFQPEEGEPDGQRHADYLQFLETVPLLSSLVKPELVKLASSVHTEEFTAGTEIVKQGQTGDAMYIVRNGACEALVGGCVVERIERGQFFGEVALVQEGNKRAATVRVAEGSESAICLRIERAPFDVLINAGEVRKVITERVEAILDGGVIPDRMAEICLRMSQPREGSKAVRITGEPPLTQKELCKVVDSSIFRDWVAAVEKDDKLFIAQVRSHASYWCHWHCGALQSGRGRHAI